MVDIPLYLLLLALLLAVPILCLTRSSSRRHGGGLRLPPSPRWALPVIGHLHLVAGALPHRAMRDLAARLGVGGAPAPLMLLRLCELRAVVASSADAAREVMRTHDLAFATRPLNPTGKVLMGEHSPGLIFTPYGDGWRTLRRVCVLELLSARRVLSFRAVRQDELARLLRAVAESTPVNVSERISAYVADAGVRCIIGSRFKERAKFLEMMGRRIKRMPAQSLPDLFPSSRLAMLLSSMPRRMRRDRKEMMDFVDAIFHEHRERRATAVGGDVEEDLLDVLLRIQSEDGTNPVLTTENIKIVIADIFVASSETAATSLQWTMSELMRNPRVMRKAQDEVRRVIAATGHDTVTEDILPNLPYLHLVIKESLRLHPPATMLLPRECREPCRVLGYDVPEGALVLVNAWAIGRDPVYWDSPEEFKPERFEVVDVADFKGNDFEFIPFGAGRRMCPGMAFGLANMELALAGLLCHFDWELPGGMSPSEVDMAEAMGLTTRRRSHLLLVPKLRVPLSDREQH
uniref:Cytochrome P450 n=1 Tax=Leersia perrieri TaxID=77586 RepID=A0A0D9V155_9ORYZ